MVAQRCFRPHQWILRWLAAAHQRTQGKTTRSHQELVEALAGDKSTMSRSLLTLEKRGVGSDRSNLGRQGRISP